MAAQKLADDRAGDHVDMSVDQARLLAGAQPHSGEFDEELLARLIADPEERREPAGFDEEESTTSSGRQSGAPGAHRGLRPEEALKYWYNARVERGQIGVWASTASPAAMPRTLTTSRC